MILLDSNIVIYLSNPSIAEAIIAKINDKVIGTCNIVKAEVLGYQGLEKNEVEFFEKLFSGSTNYILNDLVTTKTIEIRKTKKIGLPDAIIAATAIVNDLELWTNNKSDFSDIKDLKLHNPLIV